MKMLIKFHYRKKLNRLLVQCLEEIQLSDFEINLGRVLIIVNICETRKIFLNFVPLSIQHQVFKKLHVKVTCTFTLKPTNQIS